MSWGAEVMNTAIAPMYQWNTIGWAKIERQVFKLQKRIYRAAKREDHRQVRRLQKLLLRSRAAKLVAVRNVTQDNQGKKTPGVDGVANLTPPERLELVQHLRLEDTASPVRRVYIPKPGTTEQRPLGIPTLADRAKQRSPTPWNRHGKRSLNPTAMAFAQDGAPGMRLERFYVQINQKPKWVLDADIAKCSIASTTTPCYAS